MALLDPIVTEVSALTDVVTSAVTLLDRLAELIRDTSGDPAAVQALADRVKAEKDRLAESVVKNTPASPPTP